MALVLRCKNTNYRQYSKPFVIKLVRRARSRRPLRRHRGALAVRVAGIGILTTRHGARCYKAKTIEKRPIQAASPHYAEKQIIRYFPKQKFKLKRNVFSNGLLPATVLMGTR